MQLKRTYLKASNAETRDALLNIGVRYVGNPVIAVEAEELLTLRRVAGMTLYPKLYYTNT